MRQIGFLNYQWTQPSRTSLLPPPPSSPPQRRIILRRRARVEQQIERLLQRAVEIAAAAAHFPEALGPRFRGDDRTYRAALSTAK